MSPYRAADSKRYARAVVSEHTESPFERPSERRWPAVLGVFVAAGVLAAGWWMATPIEGNEEGQSIAGDKAASAPRAPQADPGK